MTYTIVLVDISVCLVFIVSITYIEHATKVEFENAQRALSVTDFSVRIKGLAELPKELTTLQIRAKLCLELAKMVVDEEQIFEMEGD